MANTKRELYSIGHWNYSLEWLLGLLAQHQIKSLVDIRRFPGSRKFPHLSQRSLASALPEAGLEYHWLEALGGRRRSKKGGPASLNVGLRNESFRNYADYMRTEEFHQGVKKLLEIAAHKRTAIMVVGGTQHFVGDPVRCGNEIAIQLRVCSR